MNTMPGLNFQLGEDIDALRDAVREFSQAEIAPRATEIDKNDQFPMDLWRKMGDLGVLGITVGEEWGGANMGYLAHMIAMEEISRASASVGLSYGAHALFAVSAEVKHLGRGDDEPAPCFDDMARGAQLATLKRGQKVNLKFDTGHLHALRRLGETGVAARNVSQRTDGTAMKPPLLLGDPFGVRQRDLTQARLHAHQARAQVGHQPLACQAGRHALPECVVGAHGATSAALERSAFF